MNNHKRLRERYTEKRLGGKILDDGGRLHPTLAVEHMNVLALKEEELKLLALSSDEISAAPGIRLRWLKMATSDRDRAGDVMVIAGCDTTNFEKNPQFLWHHGLAGLPIHTLGRIRKIEKTDTALYALAEYAAEGLYDFADQIYRMDTAGFLPANSIGFHPIEWEELEDGGHRFTKWELIECSKVELPMNPKAVDDPSQLSLDFGEADTWLQTGVVRQVRS